MLGILPALGAEAAADVAGDHADLVLGDIEDVGGERRPHAVWVLHVGVQRVALLARVPRPDGAARFHILGVDPGDDVATAHHACGAGEGGLGRRAVADLVHVADVVGAFVPYRGPTDRLRRRRHRGQRLVVDPYPFGGILGLGQRLGHHHRDRIADVTRALARETAVRRGEHRRAVRALAME